MLRFEWAVDHFLKLFTMFDVWDVYITTFPIAVECYTWLLFLEILADSESLFSFGQTHGRSRSSRRPIGIVAAIAREMAAFLWTLGRPHKAARANSRLHSAGDGAAVGNSRR